MSPPPAEPAAKISPADRRPQQRGSAVIAAMLVVALVAATGSMLYGRMDDWIERSALLRDKAQTGELARNAVDYAGSLLAADATRGPVDSLDEEWARQLPPLRHESATLRGRISDLQGRFNLNNLRRDDGRIDDRAYAAYRRLLLSLGLAPELAETLADHLGSRPDGNRPATAEPGQPLRTPGELKRIVGYTPAVLARLQTHIGVLAGQQPVNVNTATPEVLAAIQPGLSLAAARVLADGRRGLPFRDSSDFRNRLADPALPASLVPIAAGSRHFLVDIEVDREHARSHAVALLQRPLAGRQPILLWLTLL